jgi:hypothetical protein
VTSILTFVAQKCLVDLSGLKTLLFQACYSLRAAVSPEGPPLSYSTVEASGLCC